MIYDWICEECETIWEQEHPIGTAPKQTECSECGELRNRNWSSVTTFRMKGDCHTNRVRLRDRAIKGFSKDEAHEYYDEGIASSKRAIKDGWKSYSKVTPNIDTFRKHDQVRKRSVKEVRQRVESSKKLSEIVYNHSGQDIAETLRRKPQ